MDAGGIGGGCSSDVSASGGTVCIHAGQDVPVQVRGGEQHDEGEEELNFVAALEAVVGAAEHEGGGGEEEASAGEGDEVEKFEGRAYEKARDVGGGEGMEGGGGEDEGEEGQASDPEGHGEELKEAEG